MPDVAYRLPQRRTPPASAALAWFGTAVLGFGAGFGAAYFQQYFAPVGLFPLLLGAVTGLSVGAVWTARGGGTKLQVSMAGLAAGMIAIGMLYYGSYFAARQADDRRRADVPAQVVMADPTRAQENPALRSFGAFFEREWHRGRMLGSHHVAGAWLALWLGLDAAAVVVTAALLAPAAAKLIGVDDDQTTNAGTDPSDNDRGATT